MDSENEKLVKNYKRGEYAKYSLAVKIELAKYVCCSAMQVANNGNLKPYTQSRCCLNWIKWLLISDPQSLIHEMFWWRSTLKIFSLEN